MTNEEAKFILSAYRPGGHDAGDPDFHAALEQARKDPALARWFEFERKFDEAMTAKIGAIAPPPGLREAILAGGRVSGQRGSTSWWRQPQWLAMAASLALLFALGAVVLWPTRVDAQQIRNFVLNDFGGARHEGHGALNDSLQVQFGDLSKPLAEAVQVDFEQLKKGGCRSLTLQGREIFEVCFKRDGKWFHCYIARRADFPKACRLGAPPEFQATEKVHCASWTDGENLYVIAGTSGIEALKRLL